MTARLVNGPAKVTLEPQLWSDARVRAVALDTGLDSFSVVGRIAKVWAECTARGVCELSKRDLDIYAEHRGFADALIAADLAHETAGGLHYLRGTKGRVDWLAKTIAQRSAAGQASAEARAAKLEESTARQRPVERAVNEKPTAVQRRATSDSGSERLPSASPKMGFSGSLFPSELPDRDTKGSSTPPTRDPRPVAMPVGPQQQVTAEWERRYFDRAGRSPTWHERHFANLGRLLKKHGAGPILEAIDVLFEAPPKFLADSLPDFDTLVRHFDKLARPAGKRDQSDDLAAYARELEAQEGRR